MKFTAKKKAISVAAGVAMFALVGVYGSSAWFTSVASNDSTGPKPAIAGTFNLVNNNANEYLFTADHLYPGEAPATPKTVRYTNNSNTDMSLDPSLAFSIINGSGVGYEPASVGDVEANVVWKTNKKTFESGWQKVSDITEYQADATVKKKALNQMDVVLKPNESVEVTVNVRLAGSAGNDYQGAHIGANLTVEATQATKK